MKAAKPRRRKLADMSFDEGLTRLIQTKPEEVKPPAGQKRKVAKAAKRLAALSRREPQVKHQKDRKD